MLLYHLQRHSDHHANPTRRYQALRDYADAPVLPTGYAGMILLALVPPLWRRVMDPRVLAHFDGDVGAGEHRRRASSPDSWPGTPRRVPDGRGRRGTGRRAHRAADPGGSPLPIATAACRAVPRLRLRLRRGRRRPPGGVPGRNTLVGRPRLLVLPRLRREREADFVPVVDGMSTHRDAILAAALAVTSAEGWSAITMSRLADRVGVSRQTVYNEVGSKPQLAEALVSAELARFLSLVTGAFAEHPGDPVGSVRAAVRMVLEHAAENPVTRAVVAGAAGAETDLLPLLTTRSQNVLAAATAAVAHELDAAGVVLPAPVRDALVDTVVRATVSHVVQPGAPPAQAAEGIALVVAAVIRPEHRESR